MKNIGSVLLLWVFAPVAVLAQPGPQCTACHGDQGQGSAQAPRIAGQPQAYLECQLAAYAEGARQHAVMSPIAKNLAPEARASAASHFAQIFPNAPSDSASGATANRKPPALVTRGDERKQVQACQNCHGPLGTGQADNPYLAGLSAQYFQSSLAEFKDGSRKTDASAQMPRIAAALSEADIKALAAYFASQPPPTRTRSPELQEAGREQRETAPGTATKERQGGDVTGTEPSGSQGPGGAGTK